MLISHEVCSIPIYVLTNYHKFISDKELILLCHFQAIQTSGKSAWGEVAERMGYKTISPINKMLGRLEENNYITINRGVINATALYDMCAGTQTVKVEKKVEKKDNTHYVIAAEVKDLINVDSLDGLANRIKSLLKVATEDDIRGMIDYSTSYYEYLSKDKPHQYKIAFSTLNKESIQKWIAGGRKEEFKEESKKKVFTEI